jgi:hypothetical protein
LNRYRPDIHVVRFADLLKPWVFKYKPEDEELSCNLVDQSNIPWDFVVSWWKIMHRYVKPIMEQFNQVNFSFPSSIYFPFDFIIFGI